MAQRVVPNQHRCGAGELGPEKSGARRRQRPIEPKLDTKGQDPRERSKHSLLIYVFLSSPKPHSTANSWRRVLSCSPPAPVLPPGTRYILASLIIFLFLQLAKLFPISEPQHRVSDLEHFIFSNDGLLLILWFTS